MYDADQKRDHRPEHRGDEEFLDDRLVVAVLRPLPDSVEMALQQAEIEHHRERGNDSPNT